MAEVIASRRLWMVMDSIISTGKKRERERERERDLKLI
jgi:hypothetical protein